MNKIVLLMMMGALAAGCATTHTPTSNPQGRTTMESDSPTTTIEVSSQYGGTPIMRIDIPQVVNANGDPIQPAITVTYPKRASQEVQKRFIANDSPRSARAYEDIDIEDVQRSSQDMQRRLIAYNGPAPIRTYLVDTPKSSQDMQRKQIAYDDPTPTRTYLIGAPKSSQEIQKKLVAYDDSASVQTFDDVNVAGTPRLSNLGLNMGSAQQNANEGPTESELRNALSKARANGDTKFEGEILQYARGRGMRVGKSYPINSL